MKPHLALIIEDDDLLGDIFSKSLEGVYTTEVVKDGLLALERLDQIRPMLVVLDLHLPGLNGKEILASIRSNPALAETRVILCTADERTADLLQDQADIVFLKPVNPSQLRQMAARFAN